MNDPGSSASTRNQNTKTMIATMSEATRSGSSGPRGKPHLLRVLAGLGQGGRAGPYDAHVEAVHPAEPDAEDDDRERHPEDRGQKVRRPRVGELRREPEPARGDDDPQREAADREQQQQEARREAIDSGQALCVQVTWDDGFSAKTKNHTKSAMIPVTSSGR